MKLKIYFLLLLFMVVIGNEARAVRCSDKRTVTAVTNPLPKLNFYIDKYSAEYTTHYDSVISDGSLSAGEKFRSIRNKTKAIEKSVGKDLRKAYQSHYVSGGRGHSCTKGYSGGTKDCGSKCLVPPSRDYFVVTENTWKKYHNPGSKPDNDGYTVWVHLQRSGKGRTFREFGGKWYLKPEIVTTKVLQDVSFIITEIESLRQ